MGFSKSILGDSSFYFGLIVESFLISILVTGLLAVSLSALGLGLSAIKWLVLVLEFAGALFLLFARRRFRDSLAGLPRLDGWDRTTAILIIAFFVLMLFQGGVLDMLADGWWHIAYANQMVADDSIFVSRHPITGALSNSVLYPPLWHLQLALIADFTKIDLPLLWHFMAALNALLLLSALYLMVLKLTQQKNVALTSVVLHLLIIGGLISYARVGSWPGNFSYIALFYGFAAIFSLSDQLGCSEDNYFRKVLQDKELNKSTILLLVTVGCAIGLHGVAAALLLLGLLAYQLALPFFGSSRPGSQLRNDVRVGTAILAAGVVVAIFIGLTIFDARYRFLFGSPPAQKTPFSLWIPIGILVFISGVRGLNRLPSKTFLGLLIKLVYFTALAGMLLWSVDWLHLKELFLPDPDPLGRHVPRDFQDAYGNWLFLPFWEHQLRGSLLWSGVVALFIGLILPIFRKDRAGVFLFALSSLVFLVLFSPYFFTLAAFVIPLASTYRVSLLLFAPVILAISLDYLIRTKK